MPTQGPSSSASSPQNPYRSFMVQASAGSGKTYQLCRRFLYLVAAGAKPSQVLTITFTVKAASEMRSRIIEEATRLVCHRGAQEEFNRSIELFYREAADELRSRRSGRLPSPLSAEETGKRVLSATQSLRIATIDSVFKDWVAKFPWEASAAETGQVIPASFTIMEAWEEEELHQRAWVELFKESESRALVASVWQELRAVEADKGLLGLEERIFELFRHQTYLWQLAQSGLRPLAAHPEGAGAHRAGTTWTDIVAELEAELGSIAQVCTKRQLYLDAIAAGDLELLKRERLLTRSLEVNRSTVRGKKREALADAIACVEERLQTFDQAERLARLNQLGTRFYELYEHWLAARYRHKQRLGKLEFSDLGMGCYRLFHGEAGFGATFLIQRNVRHMLIDEFQDTSLLQWSVFRKLSEELLAGDGTAEDGVEPTVFFVGDGKQSIYGFREADPEVLTHAATQMSDFRQEVVQLSHSYRTCQGVLDFIGALFTRYLDPGFPPHTTAMLGAGEPVIPNIGQVFVHEQFCDAEVGDRRGVEDEAVFIAQFLADALADPCRYPIYDKKEAGLRPLRPSDCCLLYRSSKHVELFERELRRAGVPYRREEQRSFFTRPEVRDLLAVLQSLVFPGDTVSYLHVLRSPLIGLGDAEVLTALQSLQEHGPVDALNIRRRVADAYPTTAALFAELERLMGQMLPHELVCCILARTRALTIYPQVFPGAEGSIARKNLVRLVELCSHLEDEGYASLQQCVERLEVLAARNEWGSAAADSKVVTLMTIHKAKGLEYPFVAVVGTGEEWFKLDPYWLKSREGVYYMGTQEQQPRGQRDFATRLEAARAALQEECVRLLYVALTRASQYLLISGSRPKMRHEQSFFPLIWQTLCEEGGRECANGLRVWGASPQRLGAASEPTPAEARTEPSVYAPIGPDKLLPLAAEIVQPHGEGMSSGGLGERDPRLQRLVGRFAPALARLLGVYIHAGLEAAVKGSPWPAEESWARLVRQSSVARRIRLNDDDWRQLEREADEEIAATLKSSAWKALLADADELVSEMSVIHLKNELLVRGTIDLFIAKASGLYVVDYKSMAIQLDTTTVAWPEVLRQQCRQNGITRQLQHYGEAVKAIYPGRPVFLVLWLTKCQEWLALASL